VVFLVKTKKETTTLSSNEMVKILKKNEILDH
jgi:hypothetical protein